MKYIHSNLLKSTSILFLILASQACDKEFSEIGTGIIGTPGFEIQSATYPVKTYNKKITAFESNNLSKNLLGYYYDPVFGGTKVDFVGQLTPKNFAPNFGENPVLDSVVLTVPYASTATTNATTEATSYELDSLYGLGKVNLSIYKSNYYLRDFDPNSTIDGSQKYYSDGSLSETEAISETALRGQLLYHDDAYFPSAESIDLEEINEETGVSEVTSTIAPSLRLNLYSADFQNSNPPVGFWENLILNKQDDDVLANANNFYNHFRGLYFKIEPESLENGHIQQLDFASAAATVILYYSYTSETTVDGEVETGTSQGTYEMGFSGKRVSVFENTFNAEVLAAIGNDTDEDERLYLKGGEGSMAIVKLFTEDEFGNSETDQLNEFRTLEEGGRITPKRLINEAYLEFYVDQTASNEDQPNRVYIYDIENNIPVADYFLDQTVNETSTDSKYTHLVPLSTETDESGVEQKKYKIRITEHLNNIIVRDSTNVELGLVVSSNVGEASSKGVLDNNSLTIPVGSILTPKSIILHGSNSTNEAKRVKLNIYYTEPNN
ncbi:MAG: Uncharacterised protein [Formosa sp. Hel1_33_131]|nr:MAG: Uncharacterised protein [Formosa sp. Hel1_33_131]